MHPIRLDTHPTRRPRSRKRLVELAERATAQVRAANATGDTTTVRRLSDRLRRLADERVAAMRQERAR